jgi:DNA-binding MarR family transcriptional regulator
MTPSSATSPRRRVDFRALAQFRYEIRRFIRLSEEASRKVGLEPQHHQLLLAIKGAPSGKETSVAYLAERLQLRHNSVVGLIDRLAEHRLIVRHRSPEDHRRVLVTLTPAGEEVLHDLSVAHQDEIRSRAPQLVAAMGAIVRTAANRR